MFSYALSGGSVFGACVIIVMMVVRSQYLPPLARYAILSTAFGLLMSSRYAEVDHSVGADVFIISNIGLMIVIAVRHFQAFPRTG